MPHPDDDFFFDPEHDEAEGPERPPAFTRPAAASHLEKQRDYLERLLRAWRQAHEKKPAA